MTNSSAISTNNASNSIKVDPDTIHHADSPFSILVQPLLTRDSYGSSSRSVTMAFRAKSKLGFVNGTYPIPEDKDFIPN